MKRSLHAKRMERNHRRHGQQTKLNLVSLMDIFTILVFFLMVNSGDVEVLSSDKNISLPNSVAEKKPVLALTIKISDKDLLVDGRKLGAIGGDNTETTMEALSKELEYQASRRIELSKREQEEGFAVIIMGDQAMPYTLLKSIMTTCSSQDYRDISLAVNQVAGDTSALPNAGTTGQEI